MSYSYDNIGNWTLVDDGIYPMSYVSNNLNQYTEIEGEAYYNYDDNGNMTTDRDHAYYYDCENRLTDVVLASHVYYKYDYLGRLVKTIHASQTTKHVYDGDQIIAEYDGNGNLLRKFVYGAGIDEPVCMIAGASTYYYHYDGLGSVIALSDSSKNIVEKYSYDVFGIPTIRGTQGEVRSTSAYGNPFLFTGRMYDAQAKMYYYRARFYSPVLGRFLQPDPIGYKAGLNLYTYCKNNPVMYIDPWGLWSNHNLFGRGGGRFDYNRLDRGWTHPWNPFSTWRHFRDHRDVDRDMERAVQQGDRRAFEEHAHEGQDSFSHGSGFGGMLGHLFNPSVDRPGKNRENWNKANQWTKNWELNWDYHRALEDIPKQEKLEKELCMKKES